MINEIDITTNAVKQHTVPRFLLENFGSATGKNKRKQVFSFDKRNGNIFPASIYDASVRNKFYNVDNHPKNKSLEPFLGYHEGRAASVIKELIKSKNVTSLSPDDRIKLAEFTAIQNVRSSNEYEKVKQMSTALCERLLQMGATQEQIDKQLGPLQDSDFKNIFLQGLLNLEHETEVLMQKEWHLLETSLAHPYYISDNPISLFNRKKFAGRSNLGLALKGIQINFPLSSTLTLSMMCPSIRDDFREEREKIRYCIANHPEILKGYNPLGRIEELNNFIDGHLFTAKPNDLEHLNWLQVGFAEQYIYCQSDDFSLAKKMLNETPDLRKGPRMTIS